MGLYSPIKQPRANTNSIYIINPSIKEFKTVYFDNENSEVEVILAPLETREFPRFVGNIILNHLANFILNESGFSYKSDVKKELEEIKRKCIVYE